LFLINPAGILFGENARLDVCGSFLGTTADSILFEDGEFNATDLNNPPVLTINAPIGLGFRDNPGDIVNQSRALDSTGQAISGLRVQPEKNLALVGGNVSLDGGVIVASGGRVELGGLTAAGTVGINNDGSLSFPERITRGDVSFTNIASVFVIGEQGGNIAVNANNLEVFGNSTLRGGTLQEIGLLNGQSGDILINATGEIAIDSSEIDNSVNIGNAGNVEINADSLTITNSAEINSSTYGRGNAGNITVNAANNISLDANSIIRSNVEEGAVGNGGQITVDTGTLNLTKGGQILTIVREARSNLPAGEGNAGNITINARDTVNLDGVSEDSNQFPSGFRSTVGDSAIGNGGNIEITSGSVDLTNGAGITSSTSSSGDGGNLIITAKQLSVRDGAGLDTDTFSAGNAGNLTINVENFTVQNSQVSASTLGKGNAGNLTVNASESVELNGELPEIDGNRGFPGGLFAQIDIAEGKGGNLTINTQRLSVSDGSKIQVATFGKGDAGELTIRASQIDVIDTEAKDNIFFTGIFAGIQQDRFGSTELAEGNAGKLTIETDRLSIIGSGRVEANNSGIGNAGDISITAKDLVEVIGVNNDTPSFIGAEVAPPDGNNPITPELISGDGGNVTINTGQLIVKDGGRVSASTYGKGDSGDLTINASDSILLQGEGSGLFAQADPKATGKGGVLNIQTGNLDLSDRA
jgi:large exoprotein involved in heme utilization and adhesion